MGLFDWLDPAVRAERRLQALYAQKLAQAERELARSGSRERHAELLAEAERIGRELDALRGERVH